MIPGSSTDNIHVVVNQNRPTPKPVPPLRYHISQHLNLLGSNPMITSGSRPEEILACDETICTESEVGGEEIQTPENREVPEELDDNDLPPLPMDPRPAPAQAQMPISLAGLFVPPGHHVVQAPPQPENPIRQTYSDWQEYFDDFHNRVNPNWGNNPTGPIVENSDPGTPLLFLTPPEGEIEAEGSTSGAEADTEEAEESPQDEPSPAKETEGYSVDPWPEID